MEGNVVSGIGFHMVTIRAIRWSATMLTFALGSLMWSGAAHAHNPAPCAPEGKVHFICGVSNAEDLANIPGTPWVVASSAAGATTKGNLLYLISVPTGKVTPIDPGEVDAAPDPQFSTCAGKLAPGTFSGHGIYVGQAPLRLYAVNHGAREGVEIFDILLGDSSATPRLRWVGCVPSPTNAQINGVVALPGGGIAVTKFYDSRDPPTRWMADTISGEATGQVLEWHSNSGWATVPDSAVSGGNGLALSADGSTYFIAAWGSRRIVRLSRTNGKTLRESVDVGINIDNLRWDSSGKIIAGGQLLAGRQDEVLKCMRGPDSFCGVPSRAVRIDPGSLSVDVIVPENDSKLFAFISAVIDVGDEWWLGTVRGDRVARVKKGDR